MERQIRREGLKRDAFCLRILMTGVCLAIAASGPLGAAEVVVQVQNLSQTDGFWLSPMWVGFHDGNFDLFDEGVYTKPGGALERLAEDGNPQPLQDQFAREAPGGTSGVIEAPGGVGDLVFFGPGETASMRFTVDPLTQRFMSFAAMVMPSNDAFIGNDDQQGGTLQRVGRLVRHPRHESRRMRCLGRGDRSEYRDRRRVLQPDPGE